MIGAKTEKQVFMRKPLREDKPARQQAYPEVSSTEIIPARHRAIASPLLQLQQTRGNRFTQRLLRSRIIQAKLTVSQPDDEYEREADRVADQVMHMPEPETGVGRLQTNDAQPLKIQRVCAACEEEEKIQRQSEEDEEKIFKTADGKTNGEVGASVESAIGSMQSHGRPLPQSTRDFFEPRFDRDFSEVRIHTDSPAAEMAKGMNARAFTVGRDVAFAAGQYSPDSMEGRKLLAHELAHVIQQRGQYLQRLTITQHGAPVEGNCGEKSIEWVFSLDNPAPCDGYIVQEIKNHVDIRGCDEPRVEGTPIKPVKTFWEAWYVKKGDKVDWTTVRDSWTDGNSRPARPDTSGVDVSRGAVKFFCKVTTGDLGDFNVAGSNPDWAPGKEPLSGALPSTRTKPSWWDSPIEGPASRWSSSWWNCCGEEKEHFSKFGFHP